MDKQSNFLNNILVALSKTKNNINPELISKTIKSHLPEYTNNKEFKVDVKSIEQLSFDIANNENISYDFEMNRKNLSRWYEIQEDEFKDTKPEQLEAEVLIHHIILENKLKKWFEEWDYVVELGEELDCIDGNEFIADIYAKRISLHGIFEVVICLVCDNPPNTWRVQALFELFESYAREDSEFSGRDILMIVTPHKFGASITKSIELQNKEEKYTVVGIEGSDLSILDSIRSPEARLLELKEHIDKAHAKSKR
ncbi:MAG TPA: hypothetical protein VK151_02170 [Fluviicola sp.]|nr:hypothetical protein [Fluviicola sp.]